MIKNILKNLLPPILLKILKKKPKYGFWGDYANWQGALADSCGYDSPDILEKVKKSLLKVKSGEAAYERDSVIFHEKQYSWPLLTCLLWIASKNDNRLNVLDFGGSLGSSYYQHKEWFAHLAEFRWNIVEQKKFVECGKKYFEDDHLKFHDKLGAALNLHPYQLAVFGSSLQYLEYPYDTLQKILDQKVPDIIVERTPFFKDYQEDRITIQRVPERIYKSSYPAWIFSLPKLKEFLEQQSYIVKFEHKEGTMPLNGDSIDLITLFAEKC